MIVWVGLNEFGGFLNSGGRYNPGADSWTATSITNAPDARDFHSAVWTGSEMIVWGGAVGFSNYSNTGGRYNPGTNSWVATSTINAPSVREYHTGGVEWQRDDRLGWIHWYQRFEHRREILRAIRTDTHNHAYTYTDSMHGEVFTYAEAACESAIAPDSTASPNTAADAYRLAASDSSTSAVEAK